MSQVGIFREFVNNYDFRLLATSSYASIVVPFIVSEYVTYSLINAQLFGKINADKEIGLLLFMLAKSVRETGMSRFGVGSSSLTYLNLPIWMLTNNVDALFRFVNESPRLIVPKLESIAIIVDYDDDYDDLVSHGYEKVLQKIIKKVPESRFTLIMKDGSMREYDDPNEFVVNFAINYDDVDAVWYGGHVIMVMHLPSVLSSEEFELLRGAIKRYFESSYRI